MLKISKDFLHDEKLKLLISFFEGSLPKKNIEFFIETCMVGEEVVALEILFDQINEQTIAISDKIFNLIKDICIEYSIEDSYWKQLEYLVNFRLDKNSDICGKVIFPRFWNEEKIMHEISNIATDPNLEWIPLTSDGGSLTKDGKPARFAVKGIRDGITIRVILEPDGEGIITGYPLFGEDVFCLIMNI